MDKVTATVRPGAPDNPEFADADGWTVTLRYQGRRMTVPFYKGPGHHGAEPTADEVLECLLSDASSFDQAGDFVGWCVDLGMDSDSRRAERTYKACQRISTNLHRLLAADFDAFAYAEEQAR